MPIKVGIFFGGPSREREISFAGGRTVYDNLDKALFEPVPIFVDSFRKWHLLDWQYLYRGTIRDFFPPIDVAPTSKHGFQVYQESLGPLDELSLEAMSSKVGRRIRRHELPELIDVAFLALHGEYGEDGQLQRELEYAGIPYTGSGVEASEIGMDKAVQKEMMAKLDFASPAIQVIEKGDFDGRRVQEHFYEAEQTIGWPMVVRPARQGSSIGVAILQETEGLAGFERAVNAAFFRELLPIQTYEALNAEARLEYVKTLSDLRDGVAFPMDAKRGEWEITLYTPDQLFDYLETATETEGYPLVVFTGHQTEQRVIVEAFIDGKEFSCIVVRTPEGKAVALPPTEIVKSSSELFDYRSKYMPGRSRKVTPIELPTERIEAIRAECERLYVALGFHVYARIDGFHTPGGAIYLNDPNTTSGMMPSSFFFHQAAEIGLNPSQFLTFIIRQSLYERAMAQGPGAGGEEARGGMEVATELGKQLDTDLDAARSAATTKERIGVILGGPSFERHISVESGRNVFEKLASSEKYLPIPFFLTNLDAVTDRKARAEQRYNLFQLPVNLLLKDNADDIRDKLAKTDEHSVIADIRADCQSITDRYADPAVVFKPRRVSWSDLPTMIDGAFIALHGRPGEDGQVQAILEPLGIYYNGSGIESSQITIDKHRTIQALSDADFKVTNQYVGRLSEFAEGEEAFYAKIKELFGYPLIAKPVDDGCSSAVCLIKDKQELMAYCHLTFRPYGLNERAARKELGVSEKDEWPQDKASILFEQLITADGADKFLEITGGMLTRYGADGTIDYEIFEPSETLAGGEVLSLEEKFLAGEGQNLTPARLGTEGYDYAHVAGQVKSDLERAARSVNVAGYCRIDAFVRVYADGRVATVPIEVNSLPGMTPATAIFHQAAIAGYQPAEFIARILAFGKERRDRLSLAKQTELVVEGAAAGAVILESSHIENAPPVPTASAKTAPSPPVSAPASAPNTESGGTAKFNTPNNPTPTPEPTNSMTTSHQKSGFIASTAAFFKSGYFWKNLIAAVLFLVLCFFLLRTGLNVYTHHGASTALPDFVGKSRTEAEAIADDQGFKLIFEKGAFDPKRPPGTVTRQHPKAGAGVKKNRSIYLTVLTDEAPMIKLPPLAGYYDYDQYTSRLSAMGEFNSKVREQVYDGKQAENTILYFFYGDQKITEESLKAGRVEIPKGSDLEFVVTVRATGEVAVPQLRCKTFGEVEFLLDGSDLVVGNIYGDVADRSTAYVTRVAPAAGEMVPTGSEFDVYLSETRPGDCN